MHRSAPPPKRSKRFPEPPTNTTAPTPNQGQPHRDRDRDRDRPTTLDHWVKGGRDRSRTTDTPTEPSSLPLCGHGSAPNLPVLDRTLTSTGHSGPGPSPPQYAQYAQTARPTEAVHEPPGIPSQTPTPVGDNIPLGRLRNVPCPMCQRTSETRHIRMCAWENGAQHVETPLPIAPTTLTARNAPPLTVPAALLHVHPEPHGPGF